MTVAEKLKSWLDEIGADGLMKPDWEDGPIAITLDDIMRDKDAHLHLQLVPAFRHADGSYHTDPELTKPCDSCGKEDCISEMAESCQVYMKWKKRWLAHKEIFMVKQYRKKPVCIEAVQFTRNNWDEVVSFTKNTAHTLMIEKSINGIATCVIPTLEGQHIATENDFIIKGVRGEFYPCKPDIFEKTYELVGDA